MRYCNFVEQSVFIYEKFGGYVYVMFGWLHDIFLKWWFLFETAGKQICWKGANLHSRRHNGVVWAQATSTIIISYHMSATTIEYIASVLVA